MNIHEKLCVKLVIYKDHSKMQGQKKNTKMIPGEEIYKFNKFKYPCIVTVTKVGRLAWLGVL